MIISGLTSIGCQLNLIVGGLSQSSWIVQHFISVSIISSTFLSGVPFFFPVNFIQCLHDMVTQWMASNNGHNQKCYHVFFDEICLLGACSYLQHVMCVLCGEQRRSSAYLLVLNTFIDNFLLERNLHRWSTSYLVFILSIIIFYTSQGVQIDFSPAWSSFFYSLLIVKLFMRRKHVTNRIWTWVERITMFFLTIRARPNWQLLTFL